MLANFFGKRTQNFLLLNLFARSDSRGFRLNHAVTSLRDLQVVLLCHLNVAQTSWGRKLRMRDWLRIRGRRGYDQSRYFIVQYFTLIYKGGIPIGNHQERGTIKMDCRVPMTHELPEEKGTSDVYLTSQH